MGTMVIGIFPDHDCLHKLTEALKSDGFSVERLRVISSDTPSDNLIRTGVQFIYSGDSEPGSIATGGGIITGFGGMGVPGLTDHAPQIGGFHSAPSTEDLLSELEIPGGRHDDYSRAIDQGRSVAGYNAGADVDRVRSLFSSAGGYPVESF